MARGLELRSGDYDPFQVVFGGMPRIKLLGALLRLGKHNFTRGEWAEEAGLTRATTIRAMIDIERLGLVEKVESGRVPIYRTAREDPLVVELSKTHSRLELAVQKQPMGNRSSATTVTVKLAPGNVRVPLASGSGFVVHSIPLDENGNGRMRVFW